jgi:hypothetical protein
MDDLSRMVNVSVTGKEENSVQPYLAITVRRGFGNDYAVDNTQVFENLSVEPHERISSPRTRAFGGLNFSSLQRILTSGSCESTSFLFCAFKPFRWLLALCIDHLSDETKHFRWLMSTLGARPNHRNLLFFQFLV